MNLVQTIWRISLTSVLVTNFSFADQTVYLDKGNPAPYPGLLMPLDRAKEIHKELIEKDYLEDINQSMKKSLDYYQQKEDLHQKKLELLLDQNDKLSQALQDSKSSTDLEKLLWFGIGIGVTGLAVYSATQLTR